MGSAVSRGFRLPGRDRAGDQAVGGSAFFGDRDARAGHGLVRSCEVCVSLACGRDFFSAGAPHDLAGALYPVAIVAMNREKDSAVSDAAFVTPGFVFGSRHAKESADNTDEYPERAGARQSCHDRTGNHERRNAWNGKGADTLEPAEYASGYNAGNGTRDCTFGGFRVSLMCEILRAGVIGE